jgi:hypothetical protein
MRLMLNTASTEAVDAAIWRGPFMRPLYDTYCFANIPSTVLHVLTGSDTAGLPTDCFGTLPCRAEAVVLFFIDALGWRFIAPRLERYPFLKHMLDNGVVSKLTSQFPSTTAAHVTCIHTGLPPAQSGVYEWFQYQPSVDRMIAPLLFSFAGDSERDTLLSVDLQPADVFPARTLYAVLRRSGVKSYLMQGKDIINSAPARALGDDATSIGYKTLPEALVNITRILKKREQPTYVFLYYSAIDAICHQYGPGSDLLEAEIDAFLTQMERIFMDRALGNVGDDVLFMLTADHGQTEVDPKRMVYLNHTWRDFKSVITQNRTGNWLTPAGSQRDYFLHVKPERLDEAQHSLSTILSGKALVIKTHELIEQGFFGPNPSDRFVQRVGNLVALPFAGESVYYYEGTKYDRSFYGHHGGLTRGEMEIPFVVCRL